MVTNSITKTPSLLSLPKPFLAISDQNHLHLRERVLVRTLYGKNVAISTSRRKLAQNQIRASTMQHTRQQHTHSETSVSIKATVSVILYVETQSNITNGIADNIADIITHAFGKSLLLELVSAELHPVTGLERPRIKGYVQRVKVVDKVATYEAKFTVPSNYGEIGAVVVVNDLNRERFIADIVLEGFELGPSRFSCNSWVAPSEFQKTNPRIFFSNKSYLPSKTPSGLKGWRQREMEALRGNGKGERIWFDRIYDYATYNDLGNPDDMISPLARPVLGGKDYPYPRRCRTGRPPSKTDKLSESRSAFVYVPRDEQFSEVKEEAFSSPHLDAIARALDRSVEAIITNPRQPFPFFSAINSLFHQGIPIIRHKSSENIWTRLVSAAFGIPDETLLFESTPRLYKRDQFSWLSDDEFCRQTLGGVNPLSIKLVTEWPLKSTLDPKIYGPAESALTTEVVQKEIGSMTVNQAMKEKKLFMLDFHDSFLPYVNKVTDLEGHTLYGSRTLFMLADNGMLRPLAIELTRPPYNGKPQWKKAFTPNGDPTNIWVWRMAKGHVVTHDVGYHQLISHWLRTHCCTEPYIIAAKQRLSAMHPIYRLLHPHFRYTMKINANARGVLINAGGIVEGTFSTGMYSLEMSSELYAKEWRFDLESLPADLIRRGIAIENPAEPHGLELAIKDYPYANDGLILWDATKQWIEDYVNHYYPNASVIESDIEIQAWWKDVRTIGHVDKKDEPWWPSLKTPKDLVHILSTIIWVASAHHAAVNFGQYDYGGYFPNRTTVARTKMPTEHPTESEWNLFLTNPESVLLQCFPSQLQGVIAMSVMELLSTHSEDEEYIGQKAKPAWEEEAAIKEAFEKFNGRMDELVKIIDERNNDSELRNRNGVGIVPYELLKPFSDKGLTARGVPNSISI